MSHAAPCDIHLPGRHHIVLNFGHTHGHLVLYLPCTEPLYLHFGIPALSSGLIPMIFDASTSDHLKPWLTKTLEPMSVRPLFFFLSSISLFDLLKFDPLDVTLTQTLWLTTFWPCSSTTGQNPNYGRSWLLSWMNFLRKVLRPLLSIFYLC